MWRKYLVNHIKHIKLVWLSIVAIHILTVRTVQLSFACTSTIYTSLFKVAFYQAIFQYSIAKPTRVGCCFLSRVSLRKLLTIRFLSQVACSKVIVGDLALITREFYESVYERFELLSKAEWKRALCNSLYQGKWRVISSFISSAF